MILSFISFQTDASSDDQVADVFINSAPGYDQPLKLNKLEELYTIVQGSDYTLTCEASGTPYPTITWKKIHEDSLGANVQQMGNILKITNAQPENRGIYQCMAQSNGQTEETSTIIEIDRKYLVIYLMFNDSSLNKLNQFKIS